MNEHEARQFALTLMESAEAVYLTTIDGDGFPHTRAMLNLRNKHDYPSLAELFAPHKGDFMLYSTTNTSSVKVDQIGANPKASAYFCIPSKFHGLMLGGLVQIVDDSPLRRRIWQDGWEMYYPGGPDDPDHTILRLTPTMAKGWHGEGRFALNVRKEP